MMPRPPSLGAYGTAGAAAAGVPMRRWGDRNLRLLLALVLLGCIALWSTAQEIAQQPSIGFVQWREADRGAIELVWAEQPRLRPAQGLVLTGLGLPDGPRLETDALLLHRSARWLSDDAQRQRYLESQAQLGALLQQPRVHLHFADGLVVPLAPQPRGFAGLGAAFWLLSASSLALLGIGAAALLSRPGWPARLFLLLAWSQAGQLALLGIASVHELAWAPGMAERDLALRLAFDAITAGAVLHGSVLALAPAPTAPRRAILAWCLAALLAVLGSIDPWPNGLWWGLQAGLVLLGLCAVTLSVRAGRRSPRALPRLLHGATVAVITAWLLLNLGVAAAAASSSDAAHRTLAALGAPLWHVLFASLLAWLPVSGPWRRPIFRALPLAVTTAGALSLGLIFGTALAPGIGPGPALAPALFLAIAACLPALPWLLDRTGGSRAAATGRMLALLDRAAHDLEHEPQRLPELLEDLLRASFAPLETRRLQHPAIGAHVAQDGAALVVPVPDLPSCTGTSGSLVLRLAHRGRRPFTDEDAALADQLVAQLRRLVAHRHAVEQGRGEERLRIAQDLHDDIGARLLTLLYRAPSRDFEDEIRHTLQDLKTLTRGLAAGECLLSEAASAWHADLQHRLRLAGCELAWRTDFDREMRLDAVRWSALTRMLRELASNAIAHAEAASLSVSLRLSQHRLELVVQDDGRGGDPASWTEGLGSAAVRKRARQLGGEVRWRALQPRGIECRLVVEGFC